MAEALGNTVRDRGFLLRSVDYGDNHRILSFLTASNGRIGVIAYSSQNSRKRFSGLLDFLHCLNVEYRLQDRGGLPQLLNCQLDRDFPWIQGDYDSNILALEWIRLLSQALHEGQHVAGLFELLEASLFELSRSDSLRTDLGFRKNLLSRLGFHLELGRCIRCAGRQEGSYRFAPENGGLLCESCDRLRVGDRIAGPWDWDAEVAPDRVSERHAEVRKLLDKSFEYFLGFAVSAKSYA